MKAKIKYLVACFISDRLQAKVTKKINNNEDIGEKLSRRWNMIQGVKVTKGHVRTSLKKIIFGK